MDMSISEKTKADLVYSLHVNDVENLIFYELADETWISKFDENAWIINDEGVKENWNIHTLHMRAAPGSLMSICFSKEMRRTKIFDAHYELIISTSLHLEYKQFPLSCLLPRLRLSIKSAEMMKFGELRSVKMNKHGSVRPASSEPKPKQAFDSQGETYGEWT
jgi:hypothetical protein